MTNERTGEGEQGEGGAQREESLAPVLSLRAQDHDCTRPCRCECHRPDVDEPGPHLATCAWADESYEPSVHPSNLPTVADVSADELVAFMRNVLGLDVSPTAAELVRQALRAGEVADLTLTMLGPSGRMVPMVPPAPGSAPLTADEREPFAALDDAFVERHLQCSVYPDQHDGHLRVAKHDRHCTRPDEGEQGPRRRELASPESLGSILARSLRAPAGTVAQPLAGDAHWRMTEILRATAIDAGHVMRAPGICLACGLDSSCDVPRLLDKHALAVAHPETAARVRRLLDAYGVVLPDALRPDGRAWRDKYHGVIVRAVAAFGELADELERLHAQIESGELDDADGHVALGPLLPALLDVAERARIAALTATRDARGVRS